MVQQPAESAPVVIPYLLYEDLDAAVDWLVGAFGLREEVRMPGPEGKAVHAALRHKDGMVMMGHPGPEYQNPKHRGGATSLVYVYVDDVDQHHAMAKAAGATILTEPQDHAYCERQYNARDFFGHHWDFTETIADIAPEDWSGGEFHLE